jgi:hypothetical protein
MFHLRLYRMRSQDHKDFDLQDIVKFINGLHEKVYVLKLDYDDDIVLRSQESPRDALISLGAMLINESYYCIDGAGLGEFVKQIYQSIFTVIIEVPRHADLDGIEFEMVDYMDEVPSIQIPFGLTEIRSVDGCYVEVLSLDHKFLNTLAQAFSRFEVVS